MSQIGFSKQLTANFGFEIIDKKIKGKKYRILVSK